MSDYNRRIAEIEDLVGKHDIALSLQDAKLKEVMVRVGEITNEAEGETDSLLKRFDNDHRGGDETQPTFKSDFQKSYDESLFSLFQFLLFLYGYSGAIATTGLVWAAIVLFQYELIDWSGESFKVPVLKPDVWLGPALYVGYIVPISIYFFWVNASCEFVSFNVP